MEAQADKINDRTISSLDHQYDMARLERIIRRLWITLIIILILFAGTNALWIYEWNQYEYADITVDSEDGGNASYLQAGTSGVINNGEGNSTNTDEEEQEE